MQITEKAWVEYITKMSQISQKAADLPDYGEVAKAVKGTKKQSPNNIPGTIARLVKQVGADTTLKNAERDGAQFAWVPHGDTCAFCITLASRGWQYMSKKAMRNGHAEHIHAHCDCEYAVRFDEKSTVAGYDPDKYLEEYYDSNGDINKMRRKRYAQNKDIINARKRKAYAEQAYRKVKRGASTEIVLTRKGTGLTIPVKRVESYETPIYISDKAKIKPKALNAINRNTENALKEYGVPLDRKPTIVVLAEDELNNALGLYDPCTNTVYYNQSLSDSEIQAYAGGKGAVERHEMWHMKQAEDFRKAGWEITKENRIEYLKELCKKAKKNIDSYEITYDNVGEISEYAEKQFIRERYDEVEAEYITLRKGAKQNDLGSSRRD